MAGKRRGIGQWTQDTLVNLVTMMGSRFDKGTANVFEFEQIDRLQLENAYRGDWVARKIVNIPAQDATREWRNWLASDDEIEKLEAFEKKIGLKRKLRQALIKSRLYGGGGLIMGFGDNQHDKELNLEAVKADGLKWVHAFAKHEVTAGQRDTNIESLNFGNPEYYELSGMNRGVGGSAPVVRIHPSRVVRFEGSEVPDWGNTGDGWGDSILQAVFDAVKNVSASTSAVATMMQEMKIDIVKVPDFTDGMGSADYREKIMQRFSLVNQAKGLVGTLLLDKEEEWQRINAQFSGVPDVMKLYLVVASGAADIPATRLLGQSAQGLNATGEGDMRNYCDMVRSVQTNEISPAMTNLDEVIIRSALGSRPPEVWFEWSPLWQSTPTERANVNKVRADTVKVLADTSLIDPVILSVGLKNMMIDEGVLPGMEQAYDEFDREGDGLDENSAAVKEQFESTKNAEAEALKLKAQNPNAPPGEPAVKPKPKLRVVGKDYMPRFTSADVKTIVDAVVKTVRDEFNENQPREADGKFGSGGGGGDKKDVSTGIEKIVSAPVKGGSPERVAMRAALKSANPEQRAVLQGKILESFKKDYDKAIKQGNGKKAAELATKTASYAKQYGKTNPVAANLTTAQANFGYSQKEVSSAKEVAASVGVTGASYSPAETAAFNDMVGLVGMSEAKQYASVSRSNIDKNPDIKATGITPGEAAHIAAYTGHAYGGVNAGLRSGILTEQQWNHIAQLNSALDKLPDYSGTTWRGGPVLSHNEFQARYPVGRVVEERAFTSSSYEKSASFGGGKPSSGKVNYVIKSRTGKVIDKLSVQGTAEKEVLFRAGTRFKVTKADAYTQTVHMEEVGLGVKKV